MARVVLIAVLVAGGGVTAGCVSPRDSSPEGLLLRAEPGDPGAQFALGVRYWLGFGVPQDDVEAVAWFRRAAEQGHVIAQAELASAYTDGRGVPQDYAEAEEWYRRAGEQRNRNAPGVRQADVEAAALYRSAAQEGNAEGQLYLGDAYFLGRGVPEDDVEASVWYRLAAEQGHALGQLSIAESYRHGRGVPQDYVLAHMWLNLAAAQGVYLAARALPQLAENMTPEQIAFAQALAREWRPGR